MTKNEALYKYLEMDYVSPFHETFYSFSVLSYDRVKWAFCFIDDRYDIKPSHSAKYYKCSRITERTILKLVKIL